MPAYRFRVLDKSDRVIAGHHNRCENDDAARAYADVLVAQIGNPNIKILSGEREVPRTERLQAKAQAEGETAH